MRPGAGDHHVVDRGRQVSEESFQRSRIIGVEGGGAQRADLARGALEALAIPGGEDQLGPLSARSSGGFEPDAGAAPITTTVCPRSWGSRRVGETVLAVVMASSGGRCGRRS